MSNIHHDPERRGVDDEFDYPAEPETGLPQWLKNMLGDYQGSENDA